VVSKQELEEAIKMRLQLFTEIGCKPTDDAVVKSLAEYIIHLAPYIVSGKMQFEVQDE
jgi:hypothetical protein